MNQSFKKNREFDAACNLLSLERGIEFHVARNVIRYQKTVKNGPRMSVVKSSVWTNAKGVPLTVFEWQGPSARLQSKISQGTSAQEWTMQDMARGLNSYANRNRQNLGYWTADEVAMEAKMDKDFNSFMSKQDNSNE